MSKPEPKNKKLYNSVVKKAKAKFDTWPSAYASGWVVKEYKKQGGKYIGSKPTKSSGLQRWFGEKWINVCKLPKKVSCGRPSANLTDWKKQYPYCRPSIKINKSTPVIASKLSKSQITSRCKRKKSNPSKRITKPSKSRRKPSKSSRMPSKSSRMPSKSSRMPSKSRRKPSKSRRKPM